MSQKTDAVVASTIGIDTGKNTLHLIGLDDQGTIVLREKVRRTAICDGCLSWRSFAMHDSTARNGSGSRASSNAVRPKLLPSRLPTKLHAWPGPSWCATNGSLKRSCCQRHSVSRAALTNWRGHDDVNADTVVPGIRQTRLGQCTFKCALSIGTRSANSIRASGQPRRINRPDT